MNDKRTQKNIRRNRRRRGVVIEMALLMMVVVVALSGLLTSTAIMQLNKQSSSGKQLEQLEQRMALDQIGRDFCTHLALPAGVDGVITRSDCTDPDCCNNCTECEEKYNPESSEPEEDAEENGDAGNTEGDADPENPGGEPTEGGGTTVQRPECCAECGCRTGCTGFTKISLVASYGEETLTVVMEKNQDGSFTVTEWSYGG